MKRCTGCCEVKQESDFREKRTKCKACESRYSRLPRARFSSTRAAAKKRNILFDLTLAQYQQITENSCHYCGGKLPEAGGGLDRIDSNGGYTISNVAPCCLECNQAKSDMNYADFKEFIAPGFKMWRMAQQLRELQKPEHEKLIKEFGVAS